MFRLTNHHQGAYCRPLLKLGLFKFFFKFWLDSPQWVRASTFMRFLDNTQRRTTVGRTPLEE